MLTSGLDVYAERFALAVLSTIDFVCWYHNQSESYVKQCTIYFHRFLFYSCGELRLGPLLFRLQAGR